MTKSISLCKSNKHLNKYIEVEKLIYIDDNYNINIVLEYFYKLKNYEHVIEYIFNIIDNSIKIAWQKFNTLQLKVYIDLKNYKIKELDIDFIKIMIHVCQDKYAENLNVIYIKNANIMIKTIYSIIRPFIDSDTRKKIFFVNKNKNKKINESNIDDLF